MSTSKLRVGIIGIGWWGALIHVPALRNTNRVEVVAISRRNPERLALAKEELAVPEAYTDWREMLDRAHLDAVVVSTPNHFHAEPTLAALERGLHVLVEKPMALTYKDAQAMVSVAEQANRILMVGYNGRGMGSWRTVKRVLEAGTIGQVRHISVACSVDLHVVRAQASAGMKGWMQSSELANAVIGDLLIDQHWRLDPVQTGGGGIVDIGTHVIDLMLWFAGAPPTQVVAFAEDVDDGLPFVFNIQARLANDTSLSLTLNNYDYGRMTVYGDRGLLTANWAGFMIKPAQEIWVEREGNREKVEPETETVAPATAFVKTVLDDEPNIAPADEAARVVALTEGVFRSIEQGRIIQLSSQ